MRRGIVAVLWGWLYPSLMLMFFAIFYFYIPCRLDGLVSVVCGGCSGYPAHFQLAQELI